jgi:hypothetical protein
VQLEIVAATALFDPQARSLARCNERTPWMERAADGDVGRVRRLAAQDLRCDPTPRISARHDRQQRLRVRVPGPLDDVSRRTLFDDAPEVHDADAIREAGGCGEVVRDHEHRQASVAKLVEDPEDPGADRDVEHRDGLVGDEQFGLQHEACCNRDPLPLAS